MPRPPRTIMKRKIRLLWWVGSSFFEGDGTGFRMIRLKDIAQRAGVSIMTVSKVLRDAPDISPNTKARVRQLAEQMGYMPDSLAQGLRNRTTKLFGLVISA